MLMVMKPIKKSIETKMMIIIIKYRKIDQMTNRHERYRNLDLLLYHLDGIPP